MKQLTYLDYDDLSFALIEALNKCRRSGVKPSPSNVIQRLPDNLQYYSLRTIQNKLNKLVRLGMVKHPEKRGGYIPRVKHVCTCPRCGYQHEARIEQIPLFELAA